MLSHLYTPVITLALIAAGPSGGCAPSTAPVIKPDPAPVVPVLYVYTSANCGPCRRNKPRIEKLQRTRDIKVIWVDVDASPEHARAMRIRYVPTYVMYLDRKQLWRTNDISTVESRSQKYRKQ